MFEEKFLTKEKYHSLSEVDQIEYNKDDMQLLIPNMEDGYIETVKSDKQSIVDHKGKVYQPLQTTEVEVIIVHCIKGGETESKSFSLTILGKYPNEGKNSKPYIIPEIAEWYGLEGEIGLSSGIKIYYEDEFIASLIPIIERNFIEINLPFELVKVESAANLILKQVKGEGHFEEGYSIDISSSNIILKYEELSGAYYGLVTLFQMIQNENAHIKQGYIRDYPSYKVRSFMLDVGRKFVRLDYLYDILKTISYYKINDFQIHLNDNAIFLESYKNAEDALYNAYTAFRLESNLEGNNYQLTSKDGYYKKEDFKKFIEYAKKLGVTIVPEIDTPGHAMSFIKIRPDLMYKGKIINDKPDQDRASMLDLSNSESLEFIKEVFNEYIEGEDSLFKNLPIHIGCDEYYGEAEIFRSYSDQLLRFIRDEKQLTPRIWGSFTDKKGDTPVTSKGVQMSLWNIDWADPEEMINQGYDLINMEDEMVYIVPGADYYQDYINNKLLFETYRPNRFTNGLTIPKSHPRLIGGGFALWNDQIDIKENGINRLDMASRIVSVLPYIAQKLWRAETSYSYETFKGIVQKLKEVPQTNLFYQVEDIRNGLDIHNSGLNVVSVEKSYEYFNFIDKKSFINLNYPYVGPNADLTIRITFDQIDGKQIILENNDGDCLYINELGNICFQLENNIFNFDVNLKAKEIYNISIKTEWEKTIVMVNEKEIHLKEDSIKKYMTFILPCERIGSISQSFQGKLYDFYIKQTVLKDGYNE